MGFFKRTNDDPSQDQRLAELRLLDEMQTVRAVMARYPRGTVLHFGAPTKCPRCGEFGFVRAVNHRRGTSHLDCFGCHAEWTITRDALKAVGEHHVRVQDLRQLRELTAPDATPTPVPTPAPQPAAFSLPVPVPVQQLEPATATAPPVPVVRLEPLELIMEQAPVAPVADHPSIRPVAARRDAGSGESGGSDERADQADQADCADHADHADRADRADRADHVDLDAPPALRVLVIDDNPFDVAVIDELLATVPSGTVEVVHAATRRDGEHVANVTRVDAVLLDLNLPDSSGITTLLEWQLGAASAAPVIVTTGDTNPETVRDAQLLGAAQFVPKAHLADLLNRADGGQKLVRMLRSTIDHALRSTGV